MTDVPRLTMPQRKDLIADTDELKKSRELFDRGDLSLRPPAALLHNVYYATPIWEYFSFAVCTS